MNTSSREVLEKRIAELEQELAEQKETCQQQKRHMELRYRNLFENAPISLWEEDFSAIGPWFDELRAKGIDDLELYLAQNPEQVRKAASLVEIVGVNRAALDLLGLSHDICLVGSFCRIFREETSHIFARELVGLWDGKNLLSFDHCGLRNDGSRYDYLLSMHVAHDENGLDLSSVVVAIADITEIKHAQVLREEVDRMARHDMKTPISMIVSLPDILLESDNLTEEQQTCVGYIRESGFRLLSMVNLSLDLYRMECGTYRLKPAPVDILPIVANVERELEAYSSAKESCLVVSVNGVPVENGQSCTIMGDELLSYSMLANLVKNAFEATPQGSPVEFSIATKPTHVECVLRNAGEVPPEIRQNFFEKYTTHGKRHGIGLGTYSARLMARTQHGNVELDDSVEGWTSLRITLPSA